jgi:AcrR family transcriptional regulator
MVAPGRVRVEQRAATEAAILDAAWRLFARSGPDAVTLREVGAAAGCSHALVVRYHGSKDDLIGAIAERLGRRVGRTLAGAGAHDDPLLEALRAARSNRPAAQLLIRTALGDLPPRGFPACLHADRLLALADDGGGEGAGSDRRSRLCAYAAASMVAGFVTFEGFVVAGTGLGSLAPGRRDLAVAGAARSVLDLAGEREPGLVARDVAPQAASVRPSEEEPLGAREALLRAAVERFALRGPSATSVRDIARHAGINPGLIHRHFGSKDALLADALERGLSDLFPPALAGEGFDFDAMSSLLHHASHGSRLVARTLVDDIEITTVRRRFPVLRRLLERYGEVPRGAGSADLSDPRLAVAATGAMALGSAVWGDHLRPALGLGARDGVESAIADVARVLVAAPLVARTPQGAAR